MFLLFCYFDVGWFTFLVSLVFIEPDPETFDDSIGEMGKWLVMLIYL